MHASSSVSSCALCNAQQVYERVADAMSSGVIHSCRPEDTVDEGKAFASRQHPALGTVRTAHQPNICAKPPDWPELTQCQ